MVTAISLIDRSVLAERLASDRLVHLYEIGDLDDFFFPLCSYFALDKSPTTIALLYDGASPATLLALDREPKSELVELILALFDRLPHEVYAHLAVGLADRLESHFHCRMKRPHVKFALEVANGMRELPRADRAEPLGPSDRHEIEQFYAESYPGSWFIPRMLETHAYYGVREERALAAIAGVHVLSRPQRVAVLGNVATHPRWRGRGLAKVACSAVIRSLEGAVDWVGLNVAADNASAIACYRSLGFSQVCAYDEMILEKRSGY